MVLMSDVEPFSSIAKEGKSRVFQKDDQDLGYVLSRLLRSCRIVLFTFCAFIAIAPELNLCVG